MIEILETILLCAKRIRSDSFENLTEKLFLYKLFMFKMYTSKQDLALYNLQGLISHKTKTNFLK